MSIEPLDILRQIRETRHTIRLCDFMLNDEHACAIYAASVARFQEIRDGAMARLESLIRQAQPVSKDDYIAGLWAAVKSHQIDWRELDELQARYVSTQQPIEVPHAHL